MPWAEGMEGVTGPFSGVRRKPSPNASQRTYSRWEPTQVLLQEEADSEGFKLEDLFGVGKIHETTRDTDFQGFTKGLHMSSSSCCFAMC